MKTMTRISALFALGLAALVSGQAAEAGWPYDHGYGYGDGYNWAFQRYALLNNQLPPYYAMFPPVYYRAPIQARTYGTSPMAYPPCDCQPAPAPVKPVMIENPYVKDKPADKSAQLRRRPLPLMILNPYVQPEPRQELAGTAPSAADPVSLSTGGK